jgi:hypothetical protein
LADFFFFDAGVAFLRLGAADLLVVARDDRFLPARLPNAASQPSAYLPVEPTRRIDMIPLSTEFPHFAYFLMQEGEVVKSARGAG